MSRLPADTVERLRLITPKPLTDRLAVLAQWRLEGTGYVPVADAAGGAAWPLPFPFRFLRPTRCR